MEGDKLGIDYDRSEQLKKPPLNPESQYSSMLSLKDVTHIMKLILTVVSLLDSRPEGLPIISACTDDDSSEVEAEPSGSVIEEVIEFIEVEVTLLTPSAIVTIQCKL